MFLFYGQNWRIDTKVTPSCTFVNVFANFNPRIQQAGLLKTEVSLKPRKCKNQKSASNL